MCNKVLFCRVHRHITESCPKRRTEGSNKIHMAEISIEMIYLYTCNYYFGKHGPRVLFPSDATVNTFTLVSKRQNKGFRENSVTSLIKHVVDPH